MCEGAKTEPSYFRAFSRENNQSFVVELTIGGGGINTIDVVAEAIRLRDEAIVPYDRVWAVFDKDSFPPNKFNGAIIKARQNGIETAWSNEAFELWYLYHFKNCTTGLQREKYRKVLSDEINSCLRKGNKKNYTYEKNDDKNYEIVTRYGDRDNAIKWAEAQHNQWEDEKFSTHNPCTTVYKLVRQLIGEDKALNVEVMKKINFEMA